MIKKINNITFHICMFSSFLNKLLNKKNYTLYPEIRWYYFVKKISYFINILIDKKIHKIFIFIMKQ